MEPRSAKKPTGRCIFCGLLGNMSKQHIIPDRVKRLVPRLRGVRHRVHHRLPGDPRPPVVEHPKDTGALWGSRKLRVVCKTCNTGWIKAVEEDAFALLEGHILGNGRDLSAEDCRKVALFSAIMFTMIDLDHLPTSVIPQTERTYIFENRQPPPRWFIYIGKLESNEWEGRFRHHSPTLISVEDITRPKVEKGQVTTLGLGKMLLHVISGGVSDDMRTDRYADLFGIGMVHPFRGIIQWDTLGALDNEIAWLLADIIVDKGMERAADLSL